MDINIHKEWVYELFGINQQLYLLIMQSQGRCAILYESKSEFLIHDKRLFNLQSLKIFLVKILLNEVYLILMINYSLYFIDSN